MTNPFAPHTKFIIEGTQQELETLHKALSAVLSDPNNGQAQVITDKFNVIFRKDDSSGTQGGLDEVDDGN